MRYKITRHFGGDLETLFAEFNDVNDANIFIDKIMASDNLSKLNPTYRLYEDNKFLTQYNNETNNAGNSQYTDNTISEPFNVIIRESLNSDLVIAKFSHLIDAKIFVTVKIHADENLNKDVTYYIFDGGKFIEKNDKSTVDSSGSTQEKKQVFRPTPLSNRPRLGPANYWVDEEDDKNKDK